MAANANGLHRHPGWPHRRAGGILALLLSPVIGKLLPRLDARAIASVSFVVLATVSFMRAGFTTGGDNFTVMPPQIVLGAGIARFCFCR